MQTAIRNPIAHRTAEAPSGLHRALALLLQGREYARELGRPAWDLAVEIEALRQAGATASTLRWLVCRGYVDHADEARPVRGRGRRFRAGSELVFTEATCFVLTRSGVVLARQLGARRDDLGSVVLATPAAEQPTVPRWDGTRRELRLGDSLVKQFRRPAPNQEAVLAAFEEEGWPLRIDDPLPLRPERPAAERLHDTINRLNRNQRQALIQFRRDGARGVFWEAVSPAGPRAADRA
jgi:hypothetical protein